MSSLDLRPERLPLVDDEGRPFEDGELGDLEPVHPPLLDALGRVRLSFSRVDTYRTCPAQFRFAYVDRLPGKPAPALSFGSSIHAALEWFYARKLPDPPPVDELLGQLYEVWDSSGFAGFPRTEQLRYYRLAQDVLRRFHEREAPRYRIPADVERWFELPVEHEAVVVGSIDRVDVVDEDGALEIVDYKTNRRVKDREQVARSLQLSIYALACEHLYGRLPRAVSYDFVVPGVRIRVPIDQLDLEHVRDVVLETAAAIREERYAPSPNRLCPWCDFRALCPAWNGEGPELLGPATEELGRLRRQVRRDVARMRQLEAGVERAAERLAGAEGPGALDDA